MTKTSSCIFCDKPARSRGLCQTHFAQFNRVKHKLDAEHAAEFDAQSVAAGLIHPVAVRVSTNPFAELADQLEKQRKQDADDDNAINVNEKRLAEIRAAAGSNQNQPTVPITPPSKKPRRTPWTK
jgi:hypothetical protein